MLDNADKLLQQLFRSTTNTVVMGDSEQIVYRAKIAKNRKGSLMHFMGCAVVLVYIVKTLSRGVSLA